MEWTEGLDKLVQATKGALTGYAKRLFMARTTRELFDGKPYRAERALGWNRATVTKGLHELESGVECVDGRRGTAGRKPIEAGLPNLLEDIRSIVDGQSQTDPTFRSTRLYTRLTVGKVRKQLIAKGYKDEELPRREQLRVKLNALGYRPRRVQKTKPKKKSRRPTPSSSR